MKARASICVASSAVCVALAAAVFLQGKTLGALRAEREQLQSPDSAESAPAETVAAPEPSAPTPVSSEILRLRSEVSQLTQRLGELSGVTAENAKLHAEVASRPNAAELPSGYIRKSQAQWVGLASPEKTIQSFLFALHHRDEGRLIHALTPEAVAHLQQRSGGSLDRFFDDASALPGMRIVGQTQMPGGSIQLQVEMIPNHKGSEVLVLVLIGGEWRLNLDL